VTVNFALLQRGELLEAGLYRVDDIYGTVDGIAAGQDGYITAALSGARAQTIVPGQPLTLRGGALYAFYAVLGKDKSGPGDDSTHGTGSGTGGNSFRLVFSIAEANSDGRDQMQASIDAQGRLSIRWDGSGHNDDTVLRASGFVAPAQAATYSYDADAIDIDGDTLTYTLAQAPTGATINASTGLVSWTPQAAGDYRFVIRADDGHGGIAEQAYMVNVARRERLLDVQGTDCNDQIDVSEDDGGIVKVTVNGATHFYSGITGIRVLALGGNDVVRLAGLTASTLVLGGSGNDKLDGSDVVVAHLELRGDAGNDDVRGGAAADYLLGGDGNDVLRGGAGGDWILGGAGKDVLFGNAGNDVLVGGDGDDTVKGGDGDDWLIRGPGCDNLDGERGTDHTVDYAAFIAGSVPGLPAQPDSMQGWNWDSAVDVPASGRKDCSIRWDGSLKNFGEPYRWSGGQGNDKSPKGSRFDFCEIDH
jgi:Ca2+-binding RTX toxin-like protein